LNEKNSFGDNTESQILLEKVINFAKEKKAAEIVAMDLRGRSTICDYFLIMTGANSRQVQSIADSILEESEKLSIPTPRIEGYKEGKWILLDMGDLVVHVFQSEERQYYNLERLWGGVPKKDFSENSDNTL